MCVVILITTACPIKGPISKWQPFVLTWSDWTAKHFDVGTNACLWTCSARVENISKTNKQRTTTIVYKFLSRCMHTVHKDPIKVHILDRIRNRVSHRAHSLHASQGADLDMTPRRRRHPSFLHLPESWWSHCRSPVCTSSISQSVELGCKFGFWYPSVRLL